ncbi:MAG: FAD-binding protein [Candidatus Methanofastidiosa archaeon]|nr:FAD-binding protein [Candidatus Methanofastidiosa archaeon]
MKTLFTNVLIVGGGIAAMKAAIAAKENIDDVTIISKGPPGKSGCSLISEGILNGTFSDDDSPGLFFDDVMRGSANVANESLVKVLTRNAKDAVLSLNEVGVDFIKEDGRLSLSLSGGNSVARTVRVSPPGPGCGKVIPARLSEQLEKMGIGIIEGHSIVKILNEGTRAVSAIAYDGNEFIQIYFKSIVLATGGGGRLYRNSTNPKGIMGDGYFLGLDAGATLVDMEYVQFFPTVALTSYLVLPFIFTDGAILLNSKSERFIANYDPVLLERTTRDKMSQAIFTEDLEGRGIDGGVYVSYKEVPIEVLETKYKGELDFFSSKGINLRNEPLLVRPACHFFMGGIRIDDGCGTSIEGLYACGECAGGVHGANRLAGNALVETLVFGDIAGRSAAQYAKEHDHLQVEANDFIESLPEPKEGKDEKEMVEGLRELSWRYLGIIRSEEGLKKALEEFDKAERQLKDVEACDLKTYFELRNMIVVLRAIALSSLTRTESRGAHFRKDYPNTDPQWKKAIIIDREFDLKFEPR